MLRMHVDFNEMAEDRSRVQINSHFYGEILSRMPPGQRVILYTPNDLEVEGNIEVERNEHGEWWFGRIDWSTLHYLDEPNTR